MIPISLDSIFSLFLLLTSILSIILGIFVLVRNRKSMINILWSGVSFCTGLWSFSLFNIVISNSNSSTVTWNKLLYIGAVFVPVLFYQFVSSLLNIKSKLNNYFIYLCYFFSVIFLIFNFLDLFFNKAPDKYGLDYWYTTGVTGYYYLFIAFFVLLVLLSFFNIAIRYQKLGGLKKNQVKYVFLTGLIGFGGGATNFFPQIFQIYPFGNFFIAFYVAVISYAIVKHRLMDIRLIVARSVAYILLITVIAAFYAGGVLGLQILFFPSELEQFSLTQGILRTALAVIMVFTFQPLRKWITEKTDHLFYKNPYNSEELLGELSHKISSTIIMSELLHKALSILVNHMKISRALFVIFKKEDRIYTNLSLGYKENIKIYGEEVARLGKAGMAIYDELGEGSQLRKLLLKYQAAVSIPLKTEKGMAGVLFLGEKSSGDMFSNQDLKIFEIIAPEIAVAVENAKAYEEIQKFTVVLKEEVSNATEELKDANKNLRELDKAKDEFISMASHQLRTPLTVIKGYLSMVLGGDVGEIKPMQKEFLTEAFNGSNKMVALINNLLNVSRMETGRFFLEPAKFDLAVVIKEEMKQLAKVAKDKKTKLVFEEQRVPKIYADEMKIRQVVMNFIDNAVHYTNQGTVKVRIYRNEKNVCFEVKDDGIGIPEDQQGKLFSKFFRADNARQFRPDGTGLGLYLAAKVIEEHKGKLIFASEENIGSTFGFSLPLEAKIKPSKRNELSRQLLSKEPKVQEIVGRISKR